MTNPRARALTLQHRRELGQLAQLVGRRTRAVAVRADVSAVADWWASGPDRQVLELVIAGHGVAARMGAAYLRRHAQLSGATVEPVLRRLDVETARRSLFATSVGAFLTSLRAHGGQGAPGAAVAAHRSMTSQLVGSAQRLVLDGARGTILETFTEGR